MIIDLWLIVFRFATSFLLYDQPRHRHIRALNIQLDEWMHTDTLKVVQNDCDNFFFHRLQLIKLSYRSWHDPSYIRSIGYIWPNDSWLRERSGWQVV